MAEQARAVEPADAMGGWIENVDFVRLREVSVAWTLPRSLGQMLGARSASLTLAGRNLATWTDYSGLDPEVSPTGQTSLLQTDFFVQPQPRTLSLRLDAKW